MALEPFCWNLDLFFFSFLIYTQLVGLLGRGISPAQGRYLHTKQHKQRINADIHPCFAWDSNPRSQRSCERRQFMPWTARPFLSTLEVLVNVNIFKRTELILVPVTCRNYRHLHVSCLLFYSSVVY
jgi:hypothetical protein